jgi:diadenosine tetraphosphate (Ap4A) HIT family hydrolase
VSACPLCSTAGGEVVWQDERLRVVLPDEPDYPGFTRVVWQTHVAEMTDLRHVDRAHLMSIVFQVEQAQREALAPDKLNLASLGNQVAHLHWHVIPRWRGDRHFPQAVWGMPAQGRDREVGEVRARAQQRMAAYRGALIAHLG